MAGIAVKLPVIRDKENGLALLQNYSEVAAQNLKMLVLTAPGERMMDPEFGVGARRFLFEQMTEETFQRFRAKLIQQQQKYLPYLTIQDVQFASSLTGNAVDENYLGIRIYYYNNILRIADVLSLPIS